MKNGWRKYQSISLPDLFGRLLKPALGRVDLAIAAVDVVLHISHVVKLKGPSALLVCVCLLILGLERIVVRLGAGSELVLCVGEEVVGAVANEEGAADFGVGDGKLRRALVGARHGRLAHELLCRPSISDMRTRRSSMDSPSSLRVSAAAMMSAVSGFRRCWDVSCRRSWQPRRNRDRGNAKLWS